MAGRVVAAERRRIQPGRLAPVEKERTLAAETIAKKEGELVKAHPYLGDDEMHRRRARHSYSVPWLAIGRIRDEGRMDRAIDDEHRSRLRGETRVRIIGEKSSRL